MKFLETLKSGRGGLIRIRSELYWYDGRGWDNNPGRVCLILGAAPAAAAAASGRDVYVDGGPGVALLLLIDCCPQWIWVSEADVEMIYEAR